MSPSHDAWADLHPELQEKLQNARDDFERVDIANEFAWDRRYAFPNSAAAAAEYARSTAETIHYERGRAYSLRNRAALHFSVGNAEQALTWVQEALAWFEAQHDGTGTLTTLLVLGGIWLRLAQLDKAYECFARALELADTARHQNPEDMVAQKNWAAAYANIGNVYIALGQIDQGLRYLLEAYRHQIELQDKRGIAITALGIAGVYAQLGRLEEAKPFLEQACELAREEGLTYILAATLSNLGHLEALQKNWEQAERYQNEALELQKAIQDGRGKAVASANLALIHFHRGQVLDALRELYEVFRALRDLNDVNLEIRLRRDLGDIHMAIQEVDAALQHYHTGMQMAQQHGMLLWEMEFNRLCAVVHERQERLSIALEYYKQYWRLYERLLGQRRQQAIAVLEKRLELERLRYEQELYRLRNEELAKALQEVERQRAETERAYAEYQRVMEERILLVSTLSHELRNLVGGIMTNADLILTGLDRLGKEVLLQTADHILRAAEHLRDSLELLSRWHALELGDTKYCYQVDNLLELVRKTVDYHQREIAYKQIQVIIDSEEEPFPVPLAWGGTQEILTNYLLNAVKYSPKGGRIWIRLRRTTDGGARVAVEDEGVGIPSGELPKLFKKLGRAQGVHPTAGEPSIGLGLFIVKWLADQMRCRVWCESCHGKGSIFYLQIPFRHEQGPYFVEDPEPEEWQYLRADYPTLEEGEQGYRPRPGWVAYFPDEDRLVFSDFYGEESPQRGTAEGAEPGAE